MQDSVSEKSGSSSDDTRTILIPTPNGDLSTSNSFNESYLGNTPPNLTLSHIPSKKKKGDEFRSLFDLRDDDLLDDYSCAYQNKSLLLHGRMYISNKNVSFYSNILGHKTSKSIPYENIVAVYKKNTALVFANAIEVVTHSGKYFFTSFMFRENAYKLLTQTWSDFVNENSSTGQSRVMLKSDGAELFTRNSENEIVFEESDDEKANDGHIHSITKKKKGQASPKKLKTLSVKYSTDEDEDNFSGDYRSDDDSKRSKKKHKKKKSWPTSKHKSVDPLPDFDDQDKFVNADNLLQPSKKENEIKVTKRTRKGSRSGTPPMVKKEKDIPSENNSEKTIPQSIREEPQNNNNEDDRLDEEISGLPFSKSCSHIRAEVVKNETKIHDRTFRVNPSLFFRLMFKNKKFLQEYTEACEYFPEWTAEDWAPTDSSDCCHSRKLSYKIPLNNNIGPKSTRVFATQYARYVNETDIIIEIQNVSKDVPFGDSFIVNEIWELKNIEGGKGNQQCNIIVNGGIIWKKSVWGLKGTIEKKSIEGSKSHGEIFLNLAQKYVDSHLKRKNLFREKTKNSGSSNEGKKDSAISNMSDDTFKIKTSRRSSTVKKKTKEKELSEPQVLNQNRPNEMEVLLKKFSLILMTLCVIIATVSIVFITMRLGTIERLITHSDSGDYTGLVAELKEQNFLLQKLISAMFNTTDFNGR